MALLDMLAGELLGPKSVGELSKSTGASGEQVKQVVTKALPLLISGMYQNSSTDEGAQSLEKALDNHAPNAEKSTSAMLSKADVKDGKKIVKHVLGDSEKEVKKELSKSTGLTQTQVSSMLGQLAPVVLSLVGNYKKEEKSGEKAGSFNLISVLGSALLGKDYQQVQPEKQEGLNLMSLASSLLGGSSQENEKEKEKEQGGGINLSGLLMNLLK
ncbi:MAG: DUF937 domain-containing protein [Lachnospiraceae bacterium]|nr:DUF937 domain-containing protein [Lachnospiraceae bacterium]